MDTSHFLIWIIFGISLAVLEIFTGTFYILFISFAAFLTGLISILFGPFHWSIETIIFAVLALASAWFVKSKQFVSKTSTFEIDEARVLKSTESIAPGESKMISYQGALWTATNVSENPILRDEMIQIVKVEGIRLLVKPQ